MVNPYFRKLFTVGIYKIYTDFYLFLFTMFIPVNPVYFKLIIDYPQHAILTTQYALRVSYQGDLFGIYVTFCRIVRIILN